MQPESITVLGGGITGLSAAFHLSRRFPTARITVINEDARFGGWVRSERVKFDYTSPSGNRVEANVLLEAGPQLLKSESLGVLELVHLLDLTSLVMVPKVPSAKETFMHIPGSPGLHPTPAHPWTVINLLKASTTLLGRVILSSIFLAPFRLGSTEDVDESVDAYFTRRLGADYARLFGSTLVHFLYAADARKLSLRAAFPSIWDAEQRGAALRRGSPRPPIKPQSSQDKSYELGDLQDKMRGVFRYTFKDGVGMLVDALVDYLQKQPNIQMLGGVIVTGLSLDASKNRFEITTSSEENLHPTHVVSALPLHELQRILPSATPLPHLTANPYSSVTVIHFIFTLPLPTVARYLVARPADGYSSAKGSGILYVSCSHNHDVSSSPCDNDQHPVKMTVVLGGPYLDTRTPLPVNVPAVLAEISEQLNRPLPSPVFTKVYTNVACISLYTVGHVQRMEALKRVLASEPWQGRMGVIGAGVGGVSVGDCVEAGRRVGKQWGQDGYRNTKS